MVPAVFSWSGGKDSALCLHKVMQEKVYDVKYLLTTVNQQFRRISMHGVREELLEAQARAIGVSLIKINVSEGTNAEYERKMKETLLGLKTQGIDHVIFGDIFLEDLRKYREDNLAKVDMKAVFPLWKQDTGKLLREFLSLQFKSILCCTNDAYLGEDWVGRMIDDNFMADLPINVDPCGENGEYHTFCFEGPIFNAPVGLTAGEKIYKPLEVKGNEDCTLPASRTNGFWFCELNLNTK